MKSKFLLRHFIALSLPLIMLFKAQSQTVWDTLPYKSYADHKLQLLNKSTISSGILYDRMLPIADIERFKAQQNLYDTSGPRHWSQAYYELYHSAYNTTGWKTPDGLESILKNNAFVNAVPIGILHYKYHVLDSNAYSDNLVDTLSNG